MAHFTLAMDGRACGISSGLQNRLSFEERQTEIKSRQRKKNIAEKTVEKI